MGFTKEYLAYLVRHASQWLYGGPGGQISMLYGRARNFSFIAEYSIFPA